MCLHSDYTQLWENNGLKGLQTLHFSLIGFLVIDYALLPRAGGRKTD